jgi:hypothetical protein
MKEDEEEEKPVVIKAQPVPHYGVPDKPHIPEDSNVEVCPFSFDTRDKECQLRKEKEKKSNAERGGAQVQGTSILIPLSCQRKR